MYHTTPKGEVKKCSAKSPETCKFGAYGHSENLQEAQKYADEYNKFTRLLEDELLHIQNKNPETYERVLKEHFQDEDVEVINDLIKQGTVSISSVKPRQGSMKHTLVDIEMKGKDKRTYHVFFFESDDNVIHNPLIDWDLSVPKDKAYLKASIQKEDFSKLEESSKGHKITLLTIAKPDNNQVFMDGNCHNVIEVQLNDGTKKIAVIQNPIKHPKIRDPKNWKMPKSTLKKTEYYKKGNPTVLMTSEMLERVPKMRKQDEIPKLDREVHGAYIIPQRNWTWYMMEYDKETGDAYGIVAGDEVEWGYFNMNELQKNKAQRLITQDFPKKVSDMMDEFKNQMEDYELKRVFGKDVENLL